MRLYLRLAWRNLWRHRRRTLIVAIAMALGLGLMIIYDGLMFGFDQAIYGNAIKVLGGNIQIHAEGYRTETGQNPLLPLPDDQAVVQAALAQPLVQTATRRIITGGLVTSAEGAFGVNIIGIEPEKEQGVNLAAQHVSDGRFINQDDGDEIFIGKGLADAMDVGVGERITMVGRSTHDQMRQRTMTVAGIYDLGMPEYEKGTVYISLAEAQALFDLAGQSTEVAIVLKQLGTEPKVMAAIEPLLPGYEIDTWRNNYPELMAAMSTKNGVMNIFSVIILLIAGIGILNLLLMAVYERTREIGVLGALGLKPRQISLLFILEGTMMGLIGVAAGIAFGLLINGLLRQVGLDFSAMATATEYMALISGRIYPTWGLEKLLSRSLTVAIIAALAALIPASEAARREPAAALHHV
ncbi:MAG: ABC transporter permease [Anaerolineales bacterium]|nr:ABC transporter permease [Anaerolineales bacterium]